jgi:hypothetical protein
VLHGEDEANSVVTGTEIHIELLVLHDSNLGVEIVSFPLSQWASQIEPFQHRSEFRSSRVFIIYAQHYRATLRVHRLPTLLKVEEDQMPARQEKQTNGLSARSRTSLYTVSLYGDMFYGLCNRITDSAQGHPVRTL